MPFTTTTSSRIFLFIAAALIACICLVNAASVTKTVELKAGSSLGIKIAKVEDDDTTTSTTENSTKSVTRTFKRITAASTKRSKISGLGFSFTFPSSGGSCGISVVESEPIVGLNYPQVPGEAPNENLNCGRYIKVTGPKGKVRVKVIDRWLDINYGDLMMSHTSFVKITGQDYSLMPVPISWEWDF